MKLYLQKQVAGGFGPWDCNFIPQSGDRSSKSWPIVDVLVVAISYVISSSWNRLYAAVHEEANIFSFFFFFFRFQPKCQILREDYADPWFIIMFLWHSIFLLPSAYFLYLFQKQHSVVVQWMEPCFLVQILTPPCSRCVILNKLLNLSFSVLFIYNLERMIVP